MQQVTRTQGCAAARAAGTQPRRCRTTHEHSHPVRPTSAQRAQFVASHLPAVHGVGDVMDFEGQKLASTISMAGVVVRMGGKVRKS